MYIYSADKSTGIMSGYFIEYDTNVSEIDDYFGKNILKCAFLLLIRN